MKKLTIEDLKAVFTTPRADHPGRRGSSPQMMVNAYGQFIDNPPNCRGLRLSWSRKNRRKLGKS